MSKTTKSKLIDAFEDDTIVRVYRANLEDGWADGYVEGIGKDFFVLGLIDKSIRFDGYNCFRLRDVTKCVSPAPHANFLQTALKKQKLKRPDFKAWELSSLSTLLESAAKRFPLLTIHLESDEAQVCYIGKLQTVSADQMTLLEVTPDGKWEARPRHYDLSHVTRVDFGSAYEEALSLVAGRSKSRSHARPNHDQ